MNGSNRADRFAEYMKKNPDAAASLRAAIKDMLKQYDFVSTGISDVARHTLAHQQSFDLMKAIKLPDELLPSFKGLVATLENLFPKNWPRPIPDLDLIATVIQEDGIPIVHIPRADILQEILDAADYDARVGVLKARADDIAVDCEEALARDCDAVLEKQVPLARRAVEAYRAGHLESAQALSVSVCDTYLKKMFVKKQYNDMKNALAISEANDTAVAIALNYHYALASAVPFLVPWKPDKGEKPPSKLSRHASIHDASTDQMTELNATVAIMLVTSMTVAIDYQATRVRGQ